MEYMTLLKTEEVFRFCAIPQVCVGTSFSPVIPSLFSLSPTLSLSTSHCLSHYFYTSLSPPSLSLSLSLSIYLFVSLSVSVFLFLFLPTSLSLSLPFFLSLSFSFFLFLTSFLDSITFFPQHIYSSILPPLSFVILSYFFGLFVSGCSPLIICSPVLMILRRK